VIEGSVVGFKTPEMIAVDLGNRLAICAKQDSILVPLEKLECAARLPAEFSLPRTEFNDHSRVAVHSRGHGVEVFRPVGDVKSDEDGLAMAQTHGFRSSSKFLFGGRSAAVEAPGGGCHPLFLALVLTVDGSKERLGIACAY
jgi:hypothetical protein